MKYTILILLMYSMALFGQDNIIIITNNDLQLTSISKSELKQIYFGQKKFWANNAPIYPTTLSNRKMKKETKPFFTEILNTTKRKYTKKWLKITFSGSGRAPKRFKKVSNLIYFISETPGAIGFIPEKYFKNKGLVKVLKIYDQ